MSVVKVAVILSVGLVVAGATTFAVFKALGWGDGGDSDNAYGVRAVPSLKLVTVISRHGNRGSSYDYPCDPYPNNDTKYWPYGVEGLTPKGRGQMYELGKRVRSLYNGFLPDTYYSEDVQASSTYMARLLMSGELFLAGLYPPKGSQVWNKQLPWQPTAIYSDSPDRTADITFVGCDKFVAEMMSVIDTVVVKYNSTMNQIVDYVTNVTGYERSSLDTTLPFIFWDKLSSEINEGYTIPEWTNYFFPAMLTPIASDEYKSVFAGTDERLRLIVGELYQQMLTAMQQKINSSLTPDRKMLYYSGHDTTIIALQRILGLPWESMVANVNPASALALELHQDNSTQEYFIQAVYLDGNSLDSAPMIVNVTSDFDTLVNNTQKYLNVDFEKECQVTNQTALRTFKTTAFPFSLI